MIFAKTELWANSLEAEPTAANFVGAIGYNFREGLISELGLEG